MQADVDENERRPNHPTPSRMFASILRSSRRIISSRSLRPRNRILCYFRLRRSKASQEEVLEPPAFGIATQAVYAGVIGSFLYGDLATRKGLSVVQGAVFGTWFTPRLQP